MLQKNNGAILVIQTYFSAVTKTKNSTMIFGNYNNATIAIIDCCKLS
jgi:hypothetical protein